MFYAVLRNRRLTDEILATTFYLEEQSFNAQQLIPASADATDLDALTPNHCLLGSAGSVLPSHQQADVDGSVTLEGKLFSTQFRTGG